jgi:hypothetical protein
LVSLSPATAKVVKKMAKILFLGTENLYVSALHGISSESRKVIMYNVIETAKTEVKQKFCVMKPPVAGPNIPAIEGIMEEYRLIV